MNLFLDPLVVSAGASVDSGVVGQGAAVAVGHNAGLDVGVGGWVQAHEGAARVSLHKWGRNERCSEYRLAYRVSLHKWGINERCSEYRLAYRDSMHKRAEMNGVVYRLKEKLFVGKGAYV